MSDFAMADIAGLLAANSTTEAKNTTSRKGNTELNMEDFLKLMIVQLQSQTIDDAMDTSEMMNQMVQMQMISAITNMTDASVMSYASSLVGKVVTIGIVDGNNLEEREVIVMGTGVMNGEQVIFGSDGNAYRLSQIMAVGHLPDEDGKYPGLLDPDPDPDDNPDDDPKVDPDDPKVDPNPDPNKPGDNNSVPPADPDTPDPNPNPDPGDSNSTPPAPPAD